MSGKPRVIVLGGCGFIGRNLVQYLAENGLASKIRVADKMLPDLAGLSKKQTEIFKSDLVDFKQANLSREAMVAKVFDTADGKWDYVFQLAGETKYSQTDEVYKENIIDVSTTCGNAAAKAGVTKFVEVSTAQVYDADKKASKEDAKLSPWTGLAKYKLKGEETLKTINGLNYVVLRPAIVYGPGDKLGIAPRIICGAVYKYTNEVMKFLWTADLRINTVHVHDVVRALWYLTTNGASGDIYNLADKNSTDQGKVNQILEKMFGIKTKFAGKMLMQLASKLLSNMDEITKTVNEKHVTPWSKMTKEAGINITPLSPYLDQELLYNKHLSIDGSKIESIGFKYERPTMTQEYLNEWVNYYIAIGLFPKGYIQ